MVLLQKILCYRMMIAKITKQLKLKMMMRILTLMKMKTLMRKK